MSIRCRRPLLTLCGDVSRIAIAMAQCRNCAPAVVSLRIEKVTCGEMVESCSDEPVTVGSVCGQPVQISCPRRVLEPAPRQGVTYPLHEVNQRGEAVFILDSKFSAMGFGRYTATVDFGDCGSKCIDVDYTCGDIDVLGVSSYNVGGA